jgi:hypothetical protein
MKARPLPAVRPVIVDRQEPKSSFLRRIATERREIVMQRLRCPVGLAVGDPGSQRRVRRLKRSGRDSGRDRVQVDVRGGGQQALLIRNTNTLAVVRWPSFAAIPERSTPSSGVVPTAQEVAPWVAVIERLWDDPEFEAEHRRRALAEARRWDGERLAEQFEQFFLSACRARG